MKEKVKRYIIEILKNYSNAEICEIAIVPKLIRIVCDEEVKEAVIEAAEKAMKRRGICSAETTALPELIWFIKEECPGAWES